LQHAIKPPYILVGLSMGVNLALEYSARWPDECQDFIGIGMPYYPDEKEARAGLHNNFWTRLTLERPRFAQFFIPLLWWLGRHGIIRPEKFSRIYTPTMAKDTMRNPYYAFKSNLLHCMVHNPQDNLLKAGENSSRLFIHGDDDEWSNVQSVRRAVAAYPQISAQIIIEYLKNHTINEPAQGAKGYHAPEEASA
jgi:pimeloyl-ACP methyl ester carboxylesterase